jgi:hypothetical protein
MTGHNGDAANDRSCNEVAQAVGSQTQQKFKHLCGEYPTASAYAMGMAAFILKQGSQAGRPARTVLVYNRYQHPHQSLMLLSAC